MTNSPTRALYVDDRDSSIVYYSIANNAQAWTPVLGAAGFEYMGTTTMAEVAGAAANISFTGADITVVGTVSPSWYRQPPSVAFTLDGTPPITFQPVANNDSQPQYNVTFYQSPELTNEPPHTLSMRTETTGSFWLDYIIVRGVPSALSVVDPDSISSLTSTLASTPTSALSTPTTSSLPSSASRLNSRAIIASGVLGGVLGLVCSLGFLWFCFLRHNRRSGHDSARTTGGYDPKNPVVVPYHGSSAYRAFTSDSFLTSASTGQPGVMVASGTAQKGQHVENQEHITAGSFASASNLVSTSGSSSVPTGAAAIQGRTGKGYRSTYLINNDSPPIYSGPFH
ncbi:hypothetical protein NP233_g849 [Leucocoprinus birnbaumii]|uniref:Transmembrane protein n=1 Tax=Leucocoprinus birnbaumii TaxID=56174 RepID=A0AAD5W3T9_9AGAR|nr:hypothetical protein NP233_g849 [Leucocoprinus birnbaumii]